MEERKKRQEYRKQCFKNLSIVNKLQLREKGREYQKIRYHNKMVAAK